MGRKVADVKEVDMRERVESTHVGQFGWHGLS